MPVSTLEKVALRWLQTQLSEILSRDIPADQAFPAKLPLSELPGEPNMRKLYRALGERGVQLPPLFLTRTQIVLVGLLPCCFVTCFVIVAAVAILVERGPIKSSDLTDVICIGLFGWAALAVLAKLFLAQRSSADTVGALAQQLCWENAPFFSRLSGAPLSHEEIKRIVIRVLAEATGADRDEITEETRLVELTE